MTQRGRLWAELASSTARLPRLTLRRVVFRAAQSAFVRDAPSCLSSRLAIELRTDLLVPDSPDLLLARAEEEAPSGNTKKEEKKAPRATTQGE